MQTKKDTGKGAAPQGGQQGGQKGGQQTAPQGGQRQTPAGNSGNRDKRMRSAEGEEE